MSSDSSVTNSTSEAGVGRLRIPTREETPQINGEGELHFFSQKIDNDVTPSGYTPVTPTPGMERIVTGSLMRPPTADGINILENEKAKNASNFIREGKAVGSYIFAPHIWTPAGQLFISVKWLLLRQILVISSAIFIFLILFEVISPHYIWPVLISTIFVVGTSLLTFNRNMCILISKRFDFVYMVGELIAGTTFMALMVRGDLRWLVMLSTTLAVVNAAFLDAGPLEVRKKQFIGVLNVAGSLFLTFTLIHFQLIPDITEDTLDLATIHYSYQQLFISRLLNVSIYLIRSLVQMVAFPAEYHTLRVHVPVSALDLAKHRESRKTRKMFKSRSNRQALDESTNRISVSSMNSSASPTSKVQLTRIDIPPLEEVKEDQIELSVITQQPITSRTESTPLEETKLVPTTPRVESQSIEDSKFEPSLTQTPLQSPQSRFSFNFLKREDGKDVFLQSEKTINSDLREIGSILFGEKWKNRIRPFLIHPCIFILRVSILLLSVLLSNLVLFGYVRNTVALAFLCTLVFCGIEIFFYHLSVLSLLIRSFECLYLFLQAFTAFIFLSQMFAWDDRVVIAFGNLILLLTGIFSDALPLDIRRRARLLLTLLFFQMLILTIGIHLHIFDVQDNTLAIMGATYGYGELFVSRMLMVLLYLLRFGIQAIRQPTDFVFIQGSIERVPWQGDVFEDKSTPTVL